jgi:L-ribulose-5-phosphate 3-epimerase UlaE
MEGNSRIMELQPIIDEIYLCHVKLQQLITKPYYSVYQNVGELTMKSLELIDELTEKMIELEMITPQLVKKN